MTKSVKPGGREPLLRCRRQSKAWLPAVRLCACAAVALLFVAVAAANIVQPAGSRVTLDTRLGAAPQRDEPQDHPGWRLAPPTKSSASRAAVATLYNTTYLAGNAATSGWTGSVAGCAPGTTTAGFQQAVIDRINYFRALVDLPPVTLQTGTSYAQVQAAALMMSANGALSHSPPTSWLCYSSAGVAGAGSSNLALGAHGPAAIDLYMQDSGSGNAAAGHRRWLLYPPRSAMATGDVPAAAGKMAANSLHVFGPTTTRPATPRGTAWPPEGFVPYQNLPGASNRWSFSYPGANFSAASISVTGPAGAMGVSIEPLATGYGDNTIVFRPAAVTYTRPSSDTAYTVSINGMTGTGVPASIQYTVTVIDPATTPASTVAFSSSSLDLGSVPVGQGVTRTIALRNTGTLPAALQAPTFAGDFSRDASASTCGASLAAGASCTLGIRFAPTALGTRRGTVAVVSDAAGSPAAAMLSGTSLVGDYASNVAAIVTGYYESILGRSPDPSGYGYWQGEVSRLAGAGANVSEVFYAMALAFFNSAEYTSRGTDNAQYVTDLYRTFFVREPDAGGLAYWQSVLAGGMPRLAVLNNFLFSTEFQAFMASAFGTAASSRAEVSAVLDYYRGILGRLPDPAGLANWLARFRAAQCQGAAAVRAEADGISQQFIGSGEYVNRDSARPAATRNGMHVADLYNAFLRRGADLSGFQYWTGQLDSGRLNRTQLRLQFLASPEFQGRVTAIIAAGCQQ